MLFYVCNKLYYIEFKNMINMALVKIIKSVFFFTYLELFYLYCFLLITTYT